MGRALASCQNQAQIGANLSGLRIDDSKRSEGKGSRWLRWVAVAVGVLVLLAGLIAAVRGRAPVVEVATVQRPTSDRPVLLNASAKITGRVLQAFAEEGMHVQQGQVLALLDDSDATARISRLRIKATTGAIQPPRTVKTTLARYINSYIVGRQ